MSRNLITKFRTQLHSRFVIMSENSGRTRKVVSDASKLPESSDPSAILKQVEFYFSDENLPTDKFLFQTAEKNDGWVPIETIHKFARMRRFQPLGAVVDALKTSKELLEVSEDNERVRRKIPLQEPKLEDRKAAFARTVYAKGFGEETETSQFDIEGFFEKYGSVKQVRLRRAEDGTFKSSVFAEFANGDDAKAFLAAEPKPAYKDNELLTMSKQAYTDMKAAEHGFTANANGKRRRFNAFKNKKGGDRPDRHHNNKRFRRNDEAKARKAESEIEPKTETAAAETTEAKTEAKTETKPEAKPEPVAANEAA